MHKLPDEKIEPEVLREMTIPLLELDPTDFEPYVKAKDLKDFTPRDQKILLAMSIFEQQNEVLLNTALLQNRQMRNLEADAIRRRNKDKEETAERKVDTWRWSLLKWIGATLGAGALAKYAFKWL